MTRRVFLALSPAAALSAAQAQDQTPPKPVFPQLFPEPSGQNGYEDLMRAADLLRASDAYLKAERDLKQLPLIRQAFADPAVAKARGLVRRALQKPMLSPRAAQPIGIATVMPDLSGLRTLARLKSMETRAAFAEGRGGDAVHAVFETLRLCEGIRGETLIAGLVEIACHAIAFASLMRHHEVWALPECQRILRLVREQMLQPNLGIATLEGERRFFQQSLDETLKTLEAGGIGELGEEGEGIAAELHAHAQDPGWREKTAAALRKRQDETLAAQLRYLDDPSGDPPPNPPPGESLEDRLASLLTPTFTQAVERFLQNRIQIQMFGVHAAIRRWRWEFDSLPLSLDDLRLESALTTDPYTRQPLLYERKNDTTYELASAGPILPAGADGKPTRQRQPIRTL